MTNQMQLKIKMNFSNIEGRTQYAFNVDSIHHVIFLSIITNKGGDLKAYLENIYEINNALRNAIQQLRKKLNLATTKDEKIELGNQINELIQLQSHKLTTRDYLDKAPEYFENYLDLLSNKEFADKINEYFSNPANQIYIKRPYIINKKYDFNQESVNELIKQFGNASNIYVFLNGDDDRVSISDFKQAVDYIDDYCDKIKVKHLSPLENATIAYENLKNIDYKFENSQYPQSNSRDRVPVILSILNNNPVIVCHGYAKILKEIYQRLGILSEIVILWGYKLKREYKEQINGHAYLMAQINDPKYQVDGLYSFDASQDNQDTLDYFAATPKEAEMLLQSHESENQFYINDSCPLMHPIPLKHFSNNERDKQKDLKNTVDFLNKFSDRKIHYIINQDYTLDLSGSIPIDEMTRSRLYTNLNIPTESHKKLYRL